MWPDPAGTVWKGRPTERSARGTARGNAFWRPSRGAEKIGMRSMHMAVKLRRRLPCDGHGRHRGHLSTVSLLRNLQARPAAPTQSPGSLSTRPATKQNEGVNSHGNNRHHAED